ncbi:hypothetical protein [Amycolatopsis sp. cmx-11-51]
MGDAQDRLSLGDRDTQCLVDKFAGSQAQICPRPYIISGPMVHVHQARL